MPPAQSSFVGRERELATLQAWLASGEARLITVLGTAGIGKSRLVHELGERDRSLFPGGVVRCNFTLANSAEDVVRALARVLGVEAKANLGAALSHALASRARCLLLADDCGHLAGESIEETLVDWLSAAPNLFIVATSWRRLRATGERPFSLAPLDSAAAKTVFLERVRAVTDRPIAGDDVEPLVAALDGLPLAMELAATSMGVLTPSQLMERREFLLDMTAEEEIWASRPLRQALALSYAALNEGEREVFLACSVFRGGFTFEQAAGLLPRVAAVDVLRRLQALADHSLLRSEATGASVFFRMFDSVRHFARDHFSSTDALRDMIRRRALYFGDEARARILSIEGVARLRAGRWLLDNEENLLSVARDGTESADEAAEDAVMWAVAGLRWIAVGRGPLEPYARLCKETVARSPRASEARGYLLLGAANIHRHLGDLENSARFGREALAWSHACGHRALEIRSLLEAARLHERLGELAAVGEMLQKAEVLADATSDTWSKLAVFFARARPEVDGIELSRITTLATQSGDPVMMVRAEAAMAVCLCAEGHNAEALMHADRVREIADELGERTWRMQADRVAAMALADQGRVAEARRALVRALEESRSIGYLHSEGEALGYLGLVEFEAGATDVARSYLREALGKLQPQEPNAIVFRAALVALEAEVDPTTPTVTVDVAGLDDAQRAAVETFAAVTRLERRGEESPAATSSLHGTQAPGAAGHPGSAVRAGQRGIEARAAQRLLRRALARVAPPNDALLVARDGSWCRGPGGQEADLSNRPLLRSLLLLLVRGHQEHDGQLLSREAIVAALWPGEKMLAKATANRLAVAASTLRKAGGLADVLVSESAGIGIRAGTRVVFVEASHRRA